MPIVRMEIVDVDQLPIGSVQRLADEIGDLLGAERGETWLQAVPIPASHYAENRQPDAARHFRPVFVSVERWGRARNQVAEARAIASLVAAILGRDRKHVHVKFGEPLAGRIAFRGEFE